MVKIIIADDHSVVRAGLKYILTSAFHGATIEEASNAEELFKKVLSMPWDIVITDISMPGKTGLEVLLEIRKIYPNLPILVMSTHPEDQYALRVMKAGASGYLNKTSAAGELVNAVNKVIQGRKYITESLAENLASSLQKGNKLPHQNLSDREFEIMKLLAQGSSVGTIGEQLSLSTSTVSTYRARILHKMSLKSNSDLTRYSLEHGLI